MPTPSPLTARLARPASRAGLLVLAFALLAFACLSSHAHETTGPKLDFTQAPRDVLPWGQLAKVGVRRAGGRLEVKFLPPVLALDGKRVALYGFMTPVGTGPMHKRFLLSMQPLFCPDCEQTGPDGIVEVNVKKPEPVHSQALAVRGTLLLVKDDSPRVLYRLVDAAVVAPRAHRSRKATDR
jgi:uncharacterized protein